MPASTRVDLQGNRYGFLPWRQRVINFSTGSDAPYKISRQESGAIFYVPKVPGTTNQVFVLPLASSKALGLNYEFYIAAQDSTGDIQIVSTGNSSVKIGLAAKTTALGVTDVQSISLETTQPTWGKLTLVSSIVWMFEQTLRKSAGYSSDDALVDEDFAGYWSTGTTA